MKSFFCLILMVVLVSPIFSGDTFNYPVNKIEGESKVTYWGTVDMSGDSIGNHYTQWMDISELCDGNAYIWGVVVSTVGTEDVNAYAQYSMNGDSTSQGVTTAYAITGLDAMTITPKIDTVNVQVGVGKVEYKTCRYMRFYFDGQTGNPETSVWWYCVLTRNTVPERKAKAWVEKSKKLIR